jgi:hypothetical protein
MKISTKETNKTTENMHDKWMYKICMWISAEEVYVLELDTHTMHGNSVYVIRTGIK